MPITISIITPSFNQGKFIERTIKSVLGQNIDGLEYYIADGGSSDNTLDVIKKYCDHLSYISERDNGQAAAVNKGIKATSGDIIGWLNSDDIYYPMALSTVLGFFSMCPDIDVLYGDAYHIDENDTVIESYYTEDWNYKRLKEVCFLCQPAVFFRRRIVDRAGLLDESKRYCMDYEYWLRLGKLTSFARVPVFLAGSRIYEKNKTIGKRVPVHKEINNMLLKNTGFVPDKWIFAYAHAAVENKGLRRDSICGNIKFVHALIIISVISFLRWQRRLPFSAVRKMAAWSASSLKNIFKETLN